MERAKPLIGWREWVRLPLLTDVAIKAKIDTGARTSALHAFDLDVETRDGQSWASFEVHPYQRNAAGRVRVELAIAAFKPVRSSNGHTELRPVISTLAVIGSQEFPIDVTLTSRDAMGFRMLVGRAALRRRFWVDAGRSFILDHGSSGRPARGPRLAKGSHT